MVTEKIKNVFARYQSKINYKPFGLGNRQKQELKVYYFMKPPEIGCLRSESEFSGRNSMKKIVLDRRKVDHNNVFMIKDIRKNYLVASLIVVEALLSEKINEINFVELECEG